MKNLLLLFCLVLFSITCFAQQDQYHPYKKFGSDIEVLTLSNGKYDEFFDYDTIAIVGSAVLNTKTMKVIGFVEEDTMYSEATMEPEVVSRWLSPDPLARKYPSLSPYNFALNNPIIYIDPDGRDVELIVGKPYVDENGEEHPYGHVALRVFNAEEGYDMVYDFGRYGQTWGIMGSKGEGILNVYNQGEKYLESEQNIRSSVGFVKTTTPEQDKMIMNHFASLIEKGDVYKSGAVPNGGGTAYKLEDDYDVISNNCCTKSTEGLEMLNSNWLGSEYDPRDAMETMEKTYKPENLKRIEYEKGGKRQSTYDPNDHNRDGNPKEKEVGKGMYQSPE